MAQVEARTTGTGEELAGQWALVTGGSKGIGLGIARELVAAGASVVLVARDTGTLEGAGDELRGEAGAGSSVVTVRGDTSDPASIAEVFRTVRAEVPQLNIAVANAGSGAVRPFLEVTLEQWQATVDLNLTGTFLCVQESARLMAEAPEGTNRSIVVVSSIRGLGARPGLVPYATTKAGVNQLVRNAAYDLAPLGIRVNALSPGITVTPLALGGDLIEERTRDVPLGRPGTPADMAAAARYLCSPASAFVTGTNLVVDGGESLW